jgi:hypothetical protein
MSWIANKLRNRIEIRKPSFEPVDGGMLQTTYTTLATIWAQIRPVSDYIQAVRHTNVNAETESPTHDFRVRAGSLEGLNIAFGGGFAEGFDVIEDLAAVKSDWYVFLQKGESSVRGRLFRVVGVKRDEQYHEFAIIRTYEVQEMGTGYAN